MSTPANSESESEIENVSSESSFLPDSLPTANPSSPPLVCLFRFAGDSAAGALMGSIFGYGSILLLVFSISYPFPFCLPGKMKCRLSSVQTVSDIIGDQCLSPDYFVSRFHVIKCFFLLF